MSFKAKTNYLGISKSGLAIVANSNGAANSLLEIVNSTGHYVGKEVFGSVSSPHCDFKIIAEITDFSLTFGRVYNTDSNTPFALSKVTIHTGAGEEPTLGLDGVQIQAGASGTNCTYSLSLPTLSPARHALPFGAFTFTESPALVLRSSDLEAGAEISVTSINGEPKAADAVRGYQQVSVSMWSDSDSTAPAVTVADGWFQSADWSCSGSDGQMFVWSATFRKHLPPSGSAS